MFTFYFGKFKKFWHCSTHARSLSLLNGVSLHMKVSEPHVCELNQ
jgi:hypothetical protein